MLDLAVAKHPFKKKNKQYNILTSNIQLGGTISQNNGGSKSH